MIWGGVRGLAGRWAETLQELDAVEIQEISEGSSSVEAAKEWRSRAPPGFRFCLEASRSIAEDGFRDTRPVAEGWAQTQSIARILHPEVLVFRAQDSFGPTDPNRLALYRFFETIERGSTAAIELPRAWATHITEKVCEDLDLVHSVDPFEREPATYGLAYFRLPGHPPDRGSYSDQDLDRLASICREYDDVFAMFVNAAAFEDAIRFAALIRSASHDARRG